MSSDDGREESSNISNLQESFSKQQEKISALKELVRKSEAAHGKSTTSAQEKVKNIAQKLTDLKSKAKSRKLEDVPSQQDATNETETTLANVVNPPILLPLPATNYSTPDPTPHKVQQYNVTATLSPATSTPSSEKILLLRQQMEHNKARMAQRASSKQHLEQLVTQLKVKFDSTQQSLEDTAELGRSMNDLSALMYIAVPKERHKSATDLSTQPFNLEKERIKFLENRCRLLEKQLEKESQAAQSAPKRIKELENKVLELQETINASAPKEIDNLVTENNKLQNELLEKIKEVQQLKNFQSKEKISTNSQIEIERLSKENKALQLRIAELEAENMQIQSEQTDTELENKSLQLRIAELEAESMQIEKEQTVVHDSSSQFERDFDMVSEEKDALLKRIAEFVEINDVLETARCDLTVKCNETEETLCVCQEQLEQTKKELQNLQEKLNVQQETVALQSNINNDTKTVDKDTDTQVKDEMAQQIQELQSEIQNLKEQNLELKETISNNEKIEVNDVSIADKIAALEATIESQREDLTNRTEALNKYEEELMEKTIELNVLNANFKVLEEKLHANTKSKPLFSADMNSADNPELQNEIQQLKQKLDESNKAMIKLKLKSKQTEKQMEKLKKTSDLHAEAISLQKINEELQQKITELEDEKGQWQLSQVDDNKSRIENTDFSQQIDKEVQDKDEKLKTLEETIRLLEEQKYDLSEKCELLTNNLEALRQEVSNKNNDETARVKSEMSEIHMEEQLEKQTQLVKSLEIQLTAKAAEVEELQSRIAELSVQKQETDKKLEHYINENMELLDKIEKLSKSSSSAESIEIVERLTQQERAEIDEYHNQIDQEHASEHEPSLVNEITQTELGSELTENITQLREESAELINKIELFTNERREVLAKMELLTAENQELKKKIVDLTEEKELMETNMLLAGDSKSKLEIQLNEVTKEKELLAAQIAESNAQNRELCQGLTSMQKSSEVMAAIDSAEHPTLFDKCEKSLSKLYSEIEAYRKANDKNAKFNVSKKLAKEAKNAHAQLSELLQKVKEASTAVETVTVVETVVAVTAPNGKALAEYEQLTAQNRELKTTVNELRQEIQDLKETVDSPTAVTSYVNEAQANENSKNLQEALEKLGKSEEEMIELQSTVENLRMQLQESRLACEEKSDEIARLDAEILSLRKLSEDFDQLMNEKEMSFEKQIEHLTRLRKELEAKCETYEGEMEILHTLVTEQKQQIIEIYKENEHEINLKLLELQQRDEQINHLHAEIKALKEISSTVKVQFSEDLQKECDKLRESLKISKALVTEQVDELANKQDTIDTLNQQIIELYKTMEENANKIIEKEDEITYMQDLVDRNNRDLERFTKENEEQKSVVDKLLIELHSHKQNAQHTSKLEMEVERLETANKELENITQELQQKNKEQLEKLKKYAANLKKRTAQCQELDTRLKDMEKGSLDALQQKENKQSDAESEEISELNAKNLLLHERIAELQQNYNDVQAKSNEIREALQLKTMEILETMERNANLENELEIARISIAQKTQETVQLQNALAASQGQMSDWDNDNSFTFNEDNNNQRELAEKSAYIGTLENDLLMKNEEILQLNNRSAQLLEQLEYNSKRNSELVEELASKTTALEKTEAALNDVQFQLLQSNELQKCGEQGTNELILQIQQQEDQIQQLTMKLSEMQNIETEVPILQQQISAQEQRLSEIGEELKAKSLKFEKSKAVIKERNNQIHQLRAQLKDLQDKLSSQPEEEVIQPVLLQVQSAVQPTTATHITIEEHSTLQQAYDKLKDDYDTEKANFVQTISRLEALHDGIQAKLQEDMSYMETLEQENAKFKDKICKLEECVACFEERRASMERRANLLDAQLQSRADEYEKTEDELIYRLNMLSNHDEVIGQRLIDSQEEKEELQERIDRFQMDYSDLSLKHMKLEKDYETYRQQTVATLENENADLSEQLKKANSELDRLRSIYDAKLAAKTTEIDELECDLSDQLQKMNNEKRKMNEELEKSRDECTLQKDEIVRLKESLNTLDQSKQELERELTWLRMQSDNAQQDQYELQELRMQTMQDKTEIDELRHQIDALAANHEIELQALRTQICELDTLRMQVGQNQTDDQVFIESENKRLTDLLAEKSTLIENYQRQNLQLQMAAAAANNQAQQIPTDPFAQAFGLPSPNNAPPATLHTDDRERELLEKTEANNRLQRELNSLQSEFNAIVEANANMQRQFLEYNREIENLGMTQSRISSSQYTNDVIPAPQMFFASEQMISSPFDEIVQMRTENSLEGAANYRTGHEAVVNNAIEQPTIEDLQRNVSDLEKHAQDLENKLATRNQLDAEYEDRLRETQILLNESETRALEREQQLQQARLEISQLEQQKIKTEQSSMEGTMQLSTLQNKIQELEALLATKHEQLQELELKLQTSIMQADQNSASAADHLKICENNFQQLQKVLQERDEEIKQLKFAINEEKLMKETVKSLDKQIITEVDSNVGAIKPTLDMFFGGPATTEFEKLVMSQVSDEPIVEEVIVPKKAYTCQPNEEVSAEKMVTGIDLADDWGDSWGNNEAAAEAAHFASTESNANARQSLVSREQQLEIQLQEETERTQELQLALNCVEQQKQEMQTKSNKLMKKLKEYKAKIDELQQSQSTNVFRKSTSVDSNSMFNDLDAAIQEELKNQITKLEAQVEEQQKVLESSLVEKEKLLSRIDVLTAGNERMSEMKERQDMDVQMYQTRIRELQQQLNKLQDWGGDNTIEVTPAGQDVHQTLNPILPHTTEASSHAVVDKTYDTHKHDLTQTIAQLTAEIADLNGDKLEIQALLEEEKSNVARAEETVRMLQQRVSVLENESAANEGLEKSKLNNIKLEYQDLQEKYNNIYDNYEKMKSEFNRLHEQEQKLAIELQQKECSLQNGQSQIEKLQNTLQETEVQFNEVQMEVLALKTQIQNLQTANAELQESNEKSIGSKTISLEVEVETLSKQYEEILLQKQLLDSQINELKAENTRLQLASSLTNSEERGNDELALQLQEKESEIVHLKQRIEDLMREDQTEKLVLEILMKNQEIQSLKTQVKQLEDDKLELQNNLSLQITKDMQFNKSAEHTNLLEEKVLKLTAQIRTLEEEGRNMEEELKVLNNHVLSSLEQEDKMKTALLNIDLKDIEIAELKKTLEAVNTMNQASEKSSDDSNSENVDFIALNAQWEAIVEQRCGEIAQMWREHMEKREEEFKLIETGLQEEISKLRAACNTPKIQKQHSISTETTASDSTTASGSSSAAPSKENTPIHTRIVNEENVTENENIIEKMRTVLESQEMEIVTLKEQLAIRSAEYARLAAQYDPFKLQTTLSHSGMTTVTTTPTADSTISRRGGGDGSLVPKSELDFALYMLHQRDVRCDEMTLELVSLLEERDTLQLKLSNTLRLVEEIKAQTNYVEQCTNREEGTTTLNSDSQEKPAVAGSTSTDSANELSQKLSQLQTVSHSKDKVIKEERDQRIRQMERIQQDLAKIPPAAVSEIVGTDLSQTNQSPSSVLLNWLWGNKPSTGGGTTSN